MPEKIKKMERRAGVRELMSLSGSRTVMVIWDRHWGANEVLVKKTRSPSEWEEKIHLRDVLVRFDSHQGGGKLKMNKKKMMMAMRMRTTMQ